MQCYEYIYIFQIFTIIVIWIKTHIRDKNNENISSNRIIVITKFLNKILLIEKKMITLILNVSQLFDN